MGFECIMCMEALENPAPPDAVAVPPDPNVAGPSKKKRKTTKPVVANTPESLAKICGTACGHVFHRVCLNRWFGQKKKKECPSCRKQLTPGKLFHLYPSLSPEDLLYGDKSPPTGLSSEEKNLLLAKIASLEEECSKLRNNNIANKATVSNASSTSTARTRKVATRSTPAAQSARQSSSRRLIPKQMARKSTGRPPRNYMPSFRRGSSPYARYAVSDYESTSSGSPASVASDQEILNNNGNGTYTVLLPKKPTTLKTFKPAVSANDRFATPSTSANTKSKFPGIGRILGSAFFDSSDSDD